MTVDVTSISLSTTPRRGSCHVYFVTILRFLNHHVTHGSMWYICSSVTFKDEVNKPSNYCPFYGHKMVLEEKKDWVFLSSSDGSQALHARPSSASPLCKDRSQLHKQTDQDSPYMHKFSRLLKALKSSLKILEGLQ